MFNLFQKALYSAGAFSVLLIEFVIISCYQGENDFLILPAIVIAIVLIIYQYFFIKNCMDKIAPIKVNIDTISIKNKFVVFSNLPYVILSVKIIWSEVNFILLFSVSVFIILLTLQQNEVVINPILFILGYHAYTIKLKTGISDYTLISKKRLRNPKEIKRVYRVFDYLLLED